MKKIHSRFTNAYCDIYSQIKFSVISKKKDFIIVCEPNRLKIIEAFFKQGFISRYVCIKKNNKTFIEVELNMVDKELALRTIKLVSTPSRLVPITLKKLFLIKKNSETFFY